MNRKLRFTPVIAAALAVAIVFSALILGEVSQPPDAQAQSAPGRPTNLTVTRANGAVTATWGAPWHSPDSVTKYHVAYSSDNKQSWSAASDSHTSNSITITGADNSKTYIVAVRSGNDHGWSSWVNSAPAGPYTPQPPSKPTNLTLTRADGTVTASWDAPSGATKYHVTYSSNNKQSWSAAAAEHPTNSITITGADNDKSYVVAVRAGNVHGWSGWRNSPSIGAYQPVSVSNLNNTTHQYCPVTGDTKCVIGFTTGSETNGYTLTEVTSKFTTTNDPNDKLGDIVVTLHPATRHPISPALATLSGSNPNPDTLTEYTYVCSGAGCALSPDTTYFIQFTATAGVNGKERYWMRTTNSNDRVLVPSGNGWSLEEYLWLHSDGKWRHYLDVGYLKVSAVKK